MDDADYAVRINAVRAAARGKRIWLSEVQGGRASHGFQTHTPVPPADQQRWFWTGVANGADTVLYWCWRDEVFGCESGGFGIVGADGHAEERLAGMRKTAEVLRKHDKLIEGYAPDRPRVGVWFSPQAYYLHWSEDNNAATAQTAVTGYSRALTRQNISHLIVEEEHLDALKDLRVLFMPRALVLDDAAAEALERFVKEGGLLVCESEFGAFASNGVYRYAEDRLLARLLGVREIGRRTLTQDYVALRLAGRELRVPARQWVTPYAGGIGTVLAEWNDAPLALDCPAGRGRIVAIGTYLGDAYHAGSSRRKDPYALLSPNFEAFVRDLVLSAGVELPVLETRSSGGASDFVRVHPGASGGKPAWYVFAAPGADVLLRLHHGRLPAKLRDAVTGAAIELRPGDRADECRLKMSDLSVALLTPA
jgi:beta-galactosidase